MQGGARKGSSSGRLDPCLSWVNNGTLIGGRGFIICHPNPLSAAHAVLECTSHVPPALVQSLLNQRSVSLRLRGQLALVASLIAHKASRNDVAPTIASPILSSKQMLSSALQLSGLAKGDAVQASKVLDGAPPHREVAVVAATTLAFEGSRSGFDEGFRLSRHGGLLNKLRKSAVPLWATHGTSRVARTGPTSPLMGNDGQNLLRGVAHQQALEL